MTDVDPAPRVGIAMSASKGNSTTTDRAGQPANGRLRYAETQELLEQAQRMSIDDCVQLAARHVDRAEYDATSVAVQALTAADPNWQFSWWADHAERVLALIRDVNPRVYLAVRRAALGTLAADLIEQDEVNVLTGGWLDRRLAAADNQDRSHAALRSAADLLDTVAAALGQLRMDTDADQASTDRLVRTVARGAMAARTAGEPPFN